MLVTLAGIITLVRPEAENASPDAGDAAGNSDAGQAGAESNASSPMIVTLPGIVTLVRLEQESNAPSPMLYIRA